MTCTTQNSTLTRKSHIHSQKVYHIRFACFGIFTSTCSHRHILTSAQENSRSSREPTETHSSKPIASPRRNGMVAISHPRMDTVCHIHKPQCSLIIIYTNTRLEHHTWTISPACFRAISVIPFAAKSPPSPH